jgi:hypothetical protein
MNGDVPRGTPPHRRVSGRAGTLGFGRRGLRCCPALAAARPRNSPRWWDRSGAACEAEVEAAGAVGRPKVRPTRGRRGSGEPTVVGSLCVMPVLGTGGGQYARARATAVSPPLAAGMREWKGTVRPPQRGPLGSRWIPGGPAAHTRLHPSAPEERDTGDPTVLSDYLAADNPLGSPPPPTCAGGTAGARGCVGAGTGLPVVPSGSTCVLVAPSEATTSRIRR